MLVSVVVCASVPQATRAPGDYGTPEGVAAEVLRADSLHDWRMLLAITHPDALREYRRDQVEMLTDDDFRGLVVADPCLVRQIWQYHQFFLDSVFRTPTTETLSQLAPDTVFARAQRFLAKYRAPRLLADSVLTTRTILGHMMADDSTAYVVLEDRGAQRPVAGWPKRHPVIMTLRLYQHTWRTMLDPDIGQSIGSVILGGNDC